MELEEHGPKKKCRRRSSFTPGRLLLPNFDKVALYQDIDTTLPAELRLAELAKKCVMYTLDVLSKEIPSFSENGIREEVETDIITKLNSLINENAFYDLCHKKRYLENPVNIEINKTVTQFESLIKKLNNESKLWEQMKTDIKNMVKNAEVKDVKKMIMFDDLPEPILTSTELYMPATKIDHSGIRKACLESLLQANCSINSLQITHSLLSDVAQNVHLQLMELQYPLTKCSNNEFRITNNETPRGLLTQMPIEKPEDTNEEL